MYFLLTRDSKQKEMSFQASKEYAPILDNFKDDDIFNYQIEAKFNKPNVITINVSHLVTTEIVFSKDYNSLNDYLADLTRVKEMVKEWARNEFFISPDLN